MNRSLRVVPGLILVSLLSFVGEARAELLLAQPGDGWEIFSSGRIGAFVEVLKGDGIPQSFGPLYDAATGMPVLDANGNPVQTRIHSVGDGGITGPSDPVLAPDGQPKQGPLLASRVRSGFLGNILGFGVRRQLTDRTRLTGFISIWGTAETDNRRTFLKNFPDEREGYIKVEGPAGSLLLGRALSLFSRGAVEINFMYGHGYGVGNPAGFDDHGPSAGHIGYGVLAPVFVAGVQYATPKFHGLQLTTAYFDPGTVVGLYWGRTKFGRPEAEATYDVEIGQLTRIHLFANGAWQAMYSNDLERDTAGNYTDKPRSTNVYGGGAGARIEIGRLHLGAAAHKGQGLGVYYALDGSNAQLAQFVTPIPPNPPPPNQQQLRIFDGAYVQAQVVLGKFDLNAGWGITRVHPLDVDINPIYFDQTTNSARTSFLKSQMGVSGVVVYHLFPYLHFALDYFNSNVKWQQGEKQVVHSFNIGSTLTW